MSVTHLVSFGCASCHFSSCGRPHASLGAAAVLRCASDPSAAAFASIPADQFALCRRVVFGGTRSRQVVHRLALFDTAGHLSHVISQSDVIK